MREIIADSRMMHIGKNGEGDALRVTFPVVGEWEALYGAGGVWTLNVQRNGDALAYAAQDFTIKDGAALWVVTDADAAVVGEGRCELTYKIGGTVAKSRTYAFRVDRSLTGGGDVPDPVKGWQEALEERVDGKLDRPDGGSAGDVLTKTGDGEEWKKPTGENVVYIAKTGTNTYAVKRNASDANPMPFAELLAMAKAPSTTVAVFDRYRLPLAALTDTGMIFESVYSATVFTVLVMQDNSAYQQSVTVMQAPLIDALEIPEWALAENKPTYTASEVGAVASQQAVADAGKVLTVGDDGKVVASGGGLSYSEKNLMLTLFKSIPYTSDVNATINSLSKIWNGTATYYSIEYNLTRITVDNEVYSIAEGGTLEIELDPDTATEITSITVTMSGIDVTSTAYANNKITINPVQGDIVITAVATSTAYTAIEYIQGDGTAWINTGYSPAAGDLVEMEFAATETNWDYVFSSYKRGSALYGFVTRMAYTIGTSTGFTRRMATDSSRQYNDRVMFTCVANTKYKLKETTAGTATLYNAAGEGLLTMVDEQASTFAEPTNPIFLLAQSNGDTPVGKIRAKEKIYKFTIIDAYGNKKLDLIPVLDSDGVACLYDKVSKKFIHDAAGGNTFIAGGQV